MSYCFSPSLITYKSSDSQLSQGVRKLIVRRADFEDLLSLAEILTNSFHEFSGFFDWLYPFFRLGIYEDLRLRLGNSSPYYNCLVATITNNQTEEIIGTAEVSLRSPSLWYDARTQYPYIANLAVKNEYRRKGVARHLLSECEQIAQAWGYNHIYLHVLDNNYKAKQLYFGSGYQIASVESDLTSWFWQSPAKLLLNKPIIADKS